MKYLIVLLLAFFVIVGLRSKATHHVSRTQQTAVSTQNDDRPEEAERMMESTRGKVLYMFWKPHCPGCEEMEPIVAQVEREYPDVKIVRINTSLEGNRPIHDKYGIYGTPTFIVFENGRLVRQHVGPFNDKQEYVAFLRPSRVY